MLKVERETPIRIDPGQNPFLSGLFAPVSREVTSDDLKVTGEIPRDLDGVYRRPSINRRRMGRRARCAYNSFVPHYEGLVKYDLESKTSERYLYGTGRTASEAPSAPRVGARDEDDGYVVTFVADANANDGGEVLILDAKNIAAGPLARVHLPQRVPIGFHSTWVPGEDPRVN